MYVLIVTKRIYIHMHITLLFLCHLYKNSMKRYSGSSLWMSLNDKTIQHIFFLSSHSSLDFPI